MRPRKLAKGGTLFKIEALQDRVTVYHDETKGAGGGSMWGHAILFIPKRIRQNLLKDLEDARSYPNVRYKGKLRFADLSESVYTPKYECSRAWIEIGVEYLKKKKGCKLGIIFFNKEAADLEYYHGDKKEKILKFVETVLRIVLKGTIHYLYDENWKVVIEEIITDGKAWHRQLSDFRIVGKLVEEVREYVTIADGAGITSVFSNHNDDRCNDINGAQFLQLTDLLLGSVIQCCLKSPKGGGKKEVVVRPVREMLNKRRRGRNFRYSSHYRSFGLTIAGIENGEWMFEQVNTGQVIYEDNQLKLFEFREGTL